MTDTWDYDQDPTGGVIPDDRPDGPRYPNITVELVGHDGNAFAIISAVNDALMHAKVDEAEREEFRAEAMAGDYSHLLRTCMHWVDVT